MFRARSELSAALAEQILDALEEGLIIFDSRDRARFCNQAFEAMWSLAREDVLTQGVPSVVEVMGRQVLNRAVLESRLADATLDDEVDIVLDEDRYLGLSTQALLSRGRPHGQVWRFRDLTAEKQSELAMLHSQKLESLGVLAGGMAHDFNNLLSSILGHSELGLADVEEDSSTAESLRAIGKAAERASGLTQQLLAYAGRGTVLVEPVDLSMLVEEVINLLAVSIDDGVELRLDLVEDLPAIIADATQMRQVVMNLLLNAAEAIASRGHIEIETGIASIGEQDLAQSLHTTKAEPGDFVYLRVTDSGSGMDDDTLARIFDPFFSTKFTGRGLGLAGVLGIVRGHHGLLRVETKPGEGTTFRVDLPSRYTPAESGAQP